MTGSGAGAWLVGATFVVIAAAVVASLFFLIPGAITSDDPSAGTSSSPTRTPSPLPNGGGVPEDENDGVVEPPVPPAPGTTVTPFITNAVLAADGATVSVYSFVPGLSESGGTCRASVVGGAESETAEGLATVEVADTVCPPLVITLAGPRDDLSVQVTYQSATASGTSESVGVSP